LLAEAGYPNGVDTVFDVSNGVFLRDREIAEAVAAQLAEVGIRVQLVPTERAKLIGDWINGVGEGITSAQWGAAADPDPLLSWTFYKRPGHKPDEQLNTLIEQTQRTVDPDQRKRLLLQFGQYVQEPTPDGQSYSNMRFYYTPGS
jgi:peptide/nickel transport system substrate-binding protein